MNKALLLLALLFCLPTTCFFAQINALHLTLRYLPDDERWGVFVKPDSTISPTSTTITGSGQVTIVMPAYYPWSNLTSHAGTWQANAIVHQPMENPSKSYVSFGLTTDGPNPIVYVHNMETLLFTFSKANYCPDTLYLIENGIDPFDEPNSYWSSPGNDLSVVDYGNIPFKLYNYKGSYDPTAWNCQPLPCSQPVQFYLQPASASVCSFTSHIFTAFVANPSNLTLMYQWQISHDSGISWLDLSDGDNFLGAQINQLTIFSVAGLDDRQFRLVAGTETCEGTSQAAVLSVNYGSDCVVLPGMPDGVNPPGSGSPLNWNKTKRQEFGADPTAERSLLQVFPNPAKGQVFARFEAPLQGEQAVLRLWNAQGMALQQAFAAEKETVSFDLENLVSGLYLLSFEVGRKVLRQEKFVKL